MTRRTLNADGTITLKSFSYWGNGDAAEAFRQELAELIWTPPVWQANF